MRSSGIGGQAVIEGVMMKNRGQYAVAVRKPNGEIEVDVKNCKDADKRKKFLRLPIIRGVVAFADSLSIGMSTLSYSANFIDEEEGESEFEKRLNEVSKGHAEGILNTFTVFFSVVLALVIFVVVPMLISSFVAQYLVFHNSSFVVSLIEGVLRVLIFIIYILIISQLEDIKRMFMYHGAEHKCINCIEHGRSLTVDNVRRSSKEHKRCGTSFMLNVMIISIVIFMFIEVDEVWIKFLLRLAAIPVIAGISYEFTRLAGNTDNIFVNLLSKPGLLMQALTTKEPDDSMIEVAIASVEAVYDWEPFVNELKNERRAVRNGETVKVNTEVKKDKPVAKPEVKKTVPAKNTKPEAKKPVQVKKPEEKPRTASENVKSETVSNEKKIAPISEEAFKPLEIDISELFDIKLPESEEKIKKSLGRHKEARNEEIRVQPISEQEADDVLAALDVMFEYSGTRTITEIGEDEEVNRSFEAKEEATVTEATETTAADNATDSTAPNGNRENSQQYGNRKKKK